MSQQLTASSLFSALALVLLCLVARVGGGMDAPPAAQPALVAFETGTGLPG